MTIAQKKSFLFSQIILLENATYQFSDFFKSLWESVRLKGKKQDGCLYKARNCFLKINRNFERTLK